MKRLIFSFIMLWTAICFCTAKVFTYEDDMYRYTLDTETEKASIASLWSLDGGPDGTHNYKEPYGDVVIPCTIKVDNTTYMITKIDDNGFKYCDDLTSIDFNLVEHIGRFAFYQCYDLAEVKSIGNFQKIETYAFYECESLSKFFCNWNLKSIEAYAFAYSGLKEVSISGVEEIGEYAFYCCSKLVWCSIGGSLEKIMPYTFYHCFRHGGFCRLPKSVTEIGNYAFYDSSMSEFPDNGNITTIGRSAFANWKPVDGFSHLKIPNSIKYIGEQAFINCRPDTITISSNVVCIGDSAFWGGPNKYLNLSNADNLETIGKGAFAKSFNFYQDTIDIPRNVTKIGDYAFDHFDVRIVNNYSKIQIIKGNVFSGGGIARYAKKVGLENISSDSYDGIYEVYNMQGIKVLETKDKDAIKSLDKGIYVVKTENATEKVMIR